MPETLDDVTATEETHNAKTEVVEEPAKEVAAADQASSEIAHEEPLKEEPAVQTAVANIAAVEEQETATLNVETVDPVADETAQPSEQAYQKGATEILEEKPSASEPAVAKDPETNPEATAESEAEEVQAQPAQPADNVAVQEEVPEPPEAQEIPTAAKEEEESKDKDSLLTPEVIAGGAAVAAAGAVAAGAAVVAHKEEPESTPVKESDVKTSDSLAVSPQVQPSANKEPADTSKAPATPEPPADPALAALAGDGEALLRKLELPSTEQLPVSTENAPKDPKKTNQENETSTAVGSGPSASLQPPSTTEGTTDNVDSKAIDSRSPSQNRSVTAVSLNNKNDSWLKSILRAVFVNFLGSIFAPFRRRGRAN